MMKTKIITIVAAVMLLEIGTVQADTVWISGHHEIVDGDVYGEIWMYNDCTLDILGGEIFRLAAYDTTFTDWFAGQMGTLWAEGGSIVNIYGGDLGDLWATDNSSVILYAYDVTHTTKGGYWDDGQVYGKYYLDDSPFSFDLYRDAYSHITIIPEPATILLFGLGGLMLRKC